MTFGNPFGGGFGAGGLDASSWGGAGPDMNPDLRARILAMIAQQPQEGEVPEATPPGFSGFNPPDALTNTMAPRLGDPNAPAPQLVRMPDSRDLPLPLSMTPGQAQQGPAFPQSALSGPLLTGAVPPSSMAPQADPLASLAPSPVAPPQAPTPPTAPPQMTGPANSVSQPDASAGARMPTLLGMQPPTMPQAAKPPVAVPGGGDEEDMPANGGVPAPKVPTTYTGMPGDKPVAAPNAVPGAPTPGVSAPTVAGVPANGAPGSTAPQAAPSLPANTAPAVAEPSSFKKTLEKLNAAGLPDQLIAFGGGLLSGRNFTEGLGRGFENMGRASQVQSASKLANAEFALKMQKAQQEQGALNANATLIKQAFPNLSDQQALGGAANSTLVSAAIAKMQNPNAGRDIKTDADGVSRFTDTGAKVFPQDDGTADPAVVKVDNKAYWLRPGEKPSDENLIGSAKDTESEGAKIAAQLKAREDWLTAHGMDPNDAGNKAWVMGGKTSAGHVLKPGDILSGPNGQELARNAGSAGASMPDQTADFLSERVLAGDTRALIGLGRGAAGAENLAKIQGLVAQKARERGLDASDLLHSAAVASGMGAQERSLGTQAGRMSAAATEAEGAIELARTASAAVSRTSYVPLNRLIQMGQSATSDPSLKAFNAANNTLVNTFARAISPTGTATDASKAHAYEMLNTADGPDAYESVLKQMKAEIEMAHKSPQRAQTILEQERQGAKPRAASPAEAAPQAAAPAVTPAKVLTFDPRTGSLK